MQVFSQKDRLPKNAQQAEEIKKWILPKPY